MHRDDPGWEDVLNYIHSYFKLKRPPTRMGHCSDGRVFRHALQLARPATGDELCHDIINIQVFTLQLSGSLAERCCFC